MSVCQKCGACCSYSAGWPVFTLESDAELDLIRPDLVSDDLHGMRCVGERCSALAGEVGRETHCAIYELRPDVCRACEPGDEACTMARRRHGLSPLRFADDAEPMRSSSDLSTTQSEGARRRS